MESENEFPRMLLCLGFRSRVCMSIEIMVISGNGELVGKLIDTKQLLLCVLFILRCNLNMRGEFFSSESTSLTRDGLLTCEWSRDGGLS
jgi:hypothetical protein